MAYQFMDDPKPVKAPVVEVSLLEDRAHVVTSPHADLERQFAERHQIASLVRNARRNLIVQCAYGACEFRHEPAVLDVRRLVLLRYACSGHPVAADRQVGAVFRQRDGLQVRARHFQPVRLQRQFFRDAVIELVFDPPWTPDRMSEAGRLELGMFF